MAHYSSDAGEFQARQLTMERVRDYELKAFFTYVSSFGQISIAVLNYLAPISAGDLKVHPIYWGRCNGPVDNVQ